MHVKKQVIINKSHPILKLIIRNCHEIGALFWAYYIVFCQSFSCFTRDNQKSLVVAIYSQIKLRNCKDLVKI